MNSLILCEGATDAILLSYYMEKVSGWTYSAKAPAGLNIRSSGGNDSVNWYKRGIDYLLICGVGGKDNFKRFFQQTLEKPIPLIMQHCYPVSFNDYMVGSPYFL